MNYCLVNIFLWVDTWFWFAVIQNENGIDNDTSSNLLPVLSEKSISLTQVLAQVILNQYQNDIQFGEAVSTKRTDVRR